MCNPISWIESDYVPNLSGLMSLPEGVKFPAECGYLDLRGLPEEAKKVLLKNGLRVI